MSGTAYGVTPTGFVKQRLDQAVSLAFADLEAGLGLPLEQGPDSLIGTIVYVICERVVSLYETGEGIYNSMYPSTAVGPALDQAVSFSGVTRLADAYSSTYETFYTTSASQSTSPPIVPSGTQVQSQTTGDAYQTTSDLSISQFAATDITLGAIQVADGQTYSVTIGQSSFSFVSPTGSTLASIVGKLVAIIGQTGFNVQSTGSGVRVWTTSETPFSLTCSSNMQPVIVGSSVIIQAVLPGPLVAPANDLSVLSSTISGVSSATNQTAVTEGDYAENDADLSLRYNLGVFRLGAAVPNAIEANLQNVVGVESATVLINATSTTDANNQAPNSVQAVVVGGSDTDVANMLFSQVAGGIATFGTTSVAITDSGGNTQQVNFSRPQNVYIWINVAVSLDVEEAFPTAGLGAVQTSIVSTGNALSPGKDVILQRFMGPIYSTVTGISNLAITVASSTDSTVVPAASSYTSSNISIGPTQQASFDLSRVSVTG